MDQAKSVSKVNQTKLALFWMHFANEPFVALFTLIGFILKKELNASMFALSFFATLSPVISFFSFFWGSYVTKNERSLLPNLIGAWVLGRVAFVRDNPVFAYYFVRLERRVCACVAEKAGVYTRDGLCFYCASFGNYKEVVV
jgi:hypothetical protein